MGELSKKLKIQKGSTTYEATIYDDVNDVGSAYLPIMVGTTQGYVGLGGTTDSEATPMRVYRNSDKNTYAVLRSVTIWDDDKIDDEFIAWVSRTIISFSDVKLTTIGDSAFFSCRNLTSVLLPAATTIESSAFSNCSSLTSISLPAATTIGDSAFSSCRSLTSVSLPAATTIGDYAFSSCSSLTSVSLPAATTIGIMTFFFCRNLTSISLPAATTIGTMTFFFCRNLTSVLLPAATTIESSAFSSCPSLTSIHFGKNNKSKIEALSGYSNKFGATSATIYFDL